MKNIFKYIILPSLLLIIFIVSFVKFNIEAFNYELSWGGNKGKWIYSDSGYIYPNHSINFKAGDSLRYNGVTVTSGTGGGGISGSDNITFSGVNTFTHKNTFSDTLKADGLSLIDNARITSDLNVTGDVISDLNFLKGSSTSIGTISTDSLAIITNNTKRIVINKNGYTNFTDTVQMSDYVQIIGNLNVGTNITALGKVTADSLLGIGYYITDINAANIASGKIDSARIPNTAKIDTANFAHTNSGITEIFNSIVTFATTVTFTVSPVFSALVNFANGINVTGNGVFSGNVTADTLKGKGNQITGVSRIITFNAAVLTTWTDSTTYFFGNYPSISPSTTEATHKVYMPCAGSIKGCILAVYKGGTAGSAQNVTVYLRVNGSDNLITSTMQWTTASNYDLATNYSLNIPFVAGDYLTFKIITPNWNPTNPLNCMVSATIYYE